MSMSTFDLGGGGNSFSFDTPGDSVTGKIVAIEEQQQTDMDTGMPAVWENGQPKMMVRVELATDLRSPDDPADDGKRSVYLKGSRKSETQSSLAAVIDAVKRASGATSIAVGGTLTLTYSGDGVPSRKGYNPPKLYTAQYVAPQVNLDPVPAAPQYQAPAPVQQPAPQAPAPVPQAPAPAPAAQQPTPEQMAAFMAYQASIQAQGA